MSRTRQRRVKSVVVHKRPPKTLLERKVDELETKLAALTELLSQTRVAVGNDLKFVRSQFEVHTVSIDQLDNNVLCTANVLREVFGQFSQIDEILRKASIDTEVNVEVVREKASKWFADVVAAGFKKTALDKQRAAEIARAREAAAKAAVEALEKEKAAETTEQAAVETELKAAESPSLSTPTTVGAGSEYPKGAQIFGG